MTLVVLAASGWLGLRELTGAGCDREVRLAVAAAPEVAPAVKATADEWIDEEPELDGACVVLEVSAAEPVDVAALVAWQHGVDLTGVGRATGATPAPDVWIPDSSIWLSRLGAAAPGFTPSVASIARSPVVLAMPEPVATELDWPDRTLTWSQVADQLRTGTRLRTGTVEPTRDAAGLVGLLALGEAVAASGASQEVTTGALRALAEDRSTVREDLLARFPRSTDSAAVASAVSAAPLSEQAVIAYNRARPPVELAAVYVEPAPTPLDYPLAVMPGGTPDKIRAAGALRTVLSGADFRDRLAAAGLRGPDGVAGSGFATPIGAPERAGGAPSAADATGEAPSASPDAAGAAPSPSPDAAAGGAPSPSPDVAGVPRRGPDVAVVERALTAWTAITLPARMLAVVDVSGSMLQRVPSAGGRTRAEVTGEAARRGLDLFDDSWAVGLWAFSTELSRDRDWRPLVPIAPLSANRRELADGLGELRPKDGGGTGLHDTVLAAYREVQNGWDPGRVNSVVMLTDGENEDDDGIGMDELLAELKDMKDDQRPIQVVLIGIGPDVGPDNLSRITAVTGGGVFIAEDPSRIDEIFLKAISLRTKVSQPVLAPPPN